MTDINNSEDILDVRDIIARVEELEDAIEAYTEKMDDWQAHADDEAELEVLRSLLAGLRGNGGDEQWRGAWYPITLIRDSYFTEYAQEFADDCGYTQRGASWPYTCIDWEQAARELRMDYSSVEFDGVTYWYR